MWVWKCGHSEKSNSSSPSALLLTVQHRYYSGKYQLPASAAVTDSQLIVVTWQKEYSGVIWIILAVCLCCYYSLVSDSEVMQIKKTYHLQILQWNILAACCCYYWYVAECVDIQKIVLVGHHLLYCSQYRHKEYILVWIFMIGKYVTLLTLPIGKRGTLDLNFENVKMQIPLKYDDLMTSNL